MELREVRAAVLLADEFEDEELTGPVTARSFSQAATMAGASRKTRSPGTQGKAAGRHPAASER